MKKNKLGVVLMLAGAVLIASALLVLLYNNNEDENAGRATEALMPVLQRAIDENIEAGEGKTSLPLDEAASDREMPVVEIDGYGYIGYLSLPALGLDLPVMSEWDYDRLKIAPCRQFGTVADNNLVIAAHNYRRHFGRLSSMKNGDPVTFTDMNGRVTAYTVESVGVISPTDVDAVQNSEWDLVIYTCTYGGASRVTVGCSRVKSDK